MTDDRLRELVSRSLDGDLDEAESHRLVELARDDDQLAREIETARRLRQAVAEVARGMEPPAALDAVMEPLRRGEPAPTRRVRPLYRWLGAAAALILGVTVTMEVVRKHPGPAADRAPAAPSRQSADSDRIFQLAPLPSAVPDEDRPVGAADRLLETEPDEPVAPEPEPLEVIGPLATTEPPRGGTSGDAPAAAVEPPAADRAQRKSAVAGRASPPAPAATTLSPSPERGEAAEPTRPGPPAGSTAARSRAADEAANGAPALELSRPTPAPAPVTLMVDGVVAWTGDATGCADGGLWLSIVVQDGVVVSVDPDPDRADESNRPAEDCRPLGLAGSSLPGVPDGRHRAELVSGR